VVELAYDLELGQDLEAQEVGFIDHEHGCLFALGGL